MGLELADHPVALIHIAGDAVKAECVCGWQTSESKDESSARAEHERVHIDGKGR